MSEAEDRKAKAARAKALLKKRQQATKSDKSPPPSRTFTPLPQDSPPTYSPTTRTGDTQNAADIFGQTSEADGTWLNSLSRVDDTPLSFSTTLVSEQDSSPPARLPHDEPPTNSPTHSLLQSLRAELQRHQDTITSLKSEHDALNKELDRRKDLETKLRDAQEKLQRESANGTSLAQAVQWLETKLRSVTSKAEELEGSLAGSRSERERLSTSFKDAEAARQQLEGRLRDALTTTSDLENRLGISQQELEEAWNQASQHQQTISLLVSEKNALTASADRLAELEPRAEELEKLLHDEVQKTSSLEVNLKRLEGDLMESSARVGHLLEQEKDYQNRCKDQERELQLTNGALNDLQAEADRHQRKAQELEERIQNDDRAEKLEGVLKDTQNRAEELEFQLSKLNQVHASLKAESDSLRSHLQTKTDSARTLETKYAELEQAHSSVQTQLAFLVSEKEDLEQVRAAVTTRADDTQKTLAELQEKLTQAATELATNSKQLHNVQNELKRTTRRAEEAEKIQSDLQNEGTNLMRSLSEMRPKIVELTNIRVVLVEKVDELEGIIRKKEDTISQLEANLDEAKERESWSAKTRQKEELARKKDESSSQQNLLHMQKAYAELEAEVEALKESLKDREAERESFHQLALRRLEEVDRLTFSVQAQTELLSTAERELEERRAASSEDRGFVEGMQNEIELLQAEIAQKDEEIERLREGLPSPNVRNSLDGEMSSALKQQQMFELSNARSQIRALESAVFEADARAHSLQKQVSSLMDQLTQLRSLSAVPTRPFSPTPGMPSRPGSRARNVSDELRVQAVRAGSSQSVSGTSNVRSSPLQKPRKSTFETLSPETKHKRRVSLGMLKARIDGELASSVKSQPPSRALTPLPEAELMKTNGAPSSSSSLMEPSEPHHIRGFKRHQFLDESHVFWCQSCHGDLVIL